MPSILVPENFKASKADPEISKNFQMEKIGEAENLVIGYALQAMDGERDLEHRQMIQERARWAQKLIDLLGLDRVV